MKTFYHPTVSIKIQLAALIFIFSVACKKVEQKIGQLKALNQSLIYEDELKYLKTNECLVEFKNNLKTSATNRLALDYQGEPLCIDSEVPKLAVRARVDIDEQKDPGKPYQHLKEHFHRVDSMGRSS